MRRFHAPPKPGQVYRHRPGAYGIFFHNGRVLLTLQEGAKREWQLPGGGIEAGENAGQSLIREALEETGWRVCVERKIGVWKQFTYMPEYEIHAEKICHIYMGRAIYPTDAPLEEGHSAALLAPWEALSRLKIEGDHWFLERVLRGRV